MSAMGFHRQHNQLYVDGVALHDIAENFGTPCYVYSAAAITQAVRALTASLPAPKPTIHYAVKANSNLAVLRLMQRLGVHVDLISAGEYARARNAGFTPAQMVFSGIGKTDAELREAIADDIGQINAESASEVEHLIALAIEMDARPAVALRINPDSTAGGHAKISTGSRQTKFGIPLDEATALYKKMAESDVINPAGLAVHIGSQIMQMDDFAEAWQKMRGLADALREAGYDVPKLDLGGGIGVNYDDGTPADLKAFGAMIARIFANSHYQLAIEPGRVLVAEAGCLLTRVIHVKAGADKRFIIIDAAMNDLMRPTLYEAYHRIEPVLESARDADTLPPADIVGPICETGDYLGLARPMPTLEAGDVLAIRSAGAYSAVMRSNYNSRVLAAEVMVLDGKAQRISKPQSLDDLLAADIIPPALMRAEK